MTRAACIRLLLLAVALVAAPGAARAQEAVTLVPESFDASRCRKVAAPAESNDAAAPVTSPITWSEFEIAGTMIESPETVRALLAPTIERHRSLTPGARADIAKRAAEFGYHLVGLGTRETATGTHAVVNIAPLPRIRSIDVDMDLSLFSSLRADEVKRRLSVRTGSYLPWAPLDLACKLHEEKLQVRALLRDEGYFDAAVDIESRVDTKHGEAKLGIEINLGDEYALAVDRSVIVDADALAIGEDEIRAKFRHEGTCLLGNYGCIGSARFRRTVFQEDVQAVTDLFRKRGYPEARVRVEDKPDRRTKTVAFKITVDQRRQLDVVFEGHNPDSVSVADLRKQLTFDSAASADDLEANESATAIAAYLQGRGFFEARVTWIRERFDVFDRIIYRIDQGKTRTVRAVEVAGNAALTDDTIRGVLGTQTARAGLFGTSAAVTSTLLAGDVDRIVDLYRRRGYRDARVTVSAATDPSALSSAALTAGLVVADQGDGIYVRFSITEGEPTRLLQLHVELGNEGDTVRTDDGRALCRQVLQHLAELYKHPELAQPVASDRCVGVANDQLLFAEDDAALTSDQLRDRLFSAGRPRASVLYETKVIGPHRVAAHYKLANLQELKFGKVVIRGNFRTRSSIILAQLDIREGAPLTQDRLANAARRLRNTSLFESVNITMPDLDTTSSGTVNAIVEVTERYDYGLLVSAEGGYSSFNGLFVKLVPSARNIGGVGISLDLAGTVGVDIAELLDDGSTELRQLSLESTLRIPAWLNPLRFQTELTAFHRRQDTPRFGLLRTTGTSLSFARTWEYPRQGKTPAHAHTLGFLYDFRSRGRNLDAIRPIGADADEAQAPITTRTGSLGVSFAWEQRTDRSGTLQPLAPESGFRFDVRATLASPYFFGQNWFIKLSAGGSRYYSPSPRIVLRGDLRYDHGIPLFGESLLPEVERFFAGGDSTVRGYEDDRLETEVIVVGVPPLANILQTRILPAGGNIRLIGSLDAQIRIWKYLASAAFFDAGLITNQWDTVTTEDIRPAVGIAVARVVTPFGTLALERALPLRPGQGDDPRGRWHLSFAARAQF